MLHIGLTILFSGFICMVIGAAPPERCIRHYEKVGCYKDSSSSRVYPELLLNHRSTSGSKSDGHKLDWDDWPNSIHALACKCSSLAREKGYKYFGLQYYGECWSGLSEIFDKFGESSKCVGYDYQPCIKQDKTECVGKASTNYIYRLLSEDYPKLQGVGEPRQNINPCPDSLCVEKSDGRYQFTTFSNNNVKSVTVKGPSFYDYYFTCNATIAQCVPCPDNTFYNQKCDQCLKSSRLALANPCYSGPVHAAASAIRSSCPLQGDAETMTECSRFGEDYKGNMVDVRNNAGRAPTPIYISCYNGKYMGCMNCPAGLVFFELKDWKNRFHVHGHCGYQPLVTVE